LAQRLPDWAALFAQVQTGPEGSESLAVVIRYLLLVGDKATHEVTGRVLHSVVDAQRAEELMRSYGEELIERGRQQGLAQGQEQGRLRGRAEAVLRILAARGVQVGEEAQQRILTCMDMATLDRWFDKSLNATTLSDVLDDLAS
jgi:hypothetical protein